MFSKVGLDLDTMMPQIKQHNLVMTACLGVQYIVILSVLGLFWDLS